jgi:fumigaclavine B O-acetyltransferase
MGNALVATAAYTQIQPIISSMSDFNYSPWGPGRVDHYDIHFLANLARYVHDGTRCVTDKYIRGAISGFAARDDWTSDSRFGDILINVLRNLDVYNLDFGPCLGPVKDYDVPDSRFPGFAWVMPANNKCRAGIWEVRLVLEPTVMERVQNDSLMKWLRPIEVPKL